MDSFRLRLDRLELKKAESILITGPSGAGKSTLLGLVCGTLVPQRGSVKVLGQKLNGLSGSARDRFRADHIGVVFQMFNLLPYLTIQDNVLLPLFFSRKRRLLAGNSKTARIAEANRILRALGMFPEQLKHKASELSVGQQQRVAVSRAFIGSPELIVADEPTSSLDEGHQADFLRLLFDEKRHSDASLLMVSHDMRMATHFDRVINLQDIVHTGLTDGAT